MKKVYAVPAVSALLGIAALLLRRVQNLKEFDAATGLPIPGGFCATALPVLLAVSAVVLAALVWKMPRESGDGPAFTEAFSAAASTDVLLPVTGSLLLGLSGAADIATAFGLLGKTVSAMSASGLSAILIGTGDHFSKGTHLILGVLTLAAAFSVFSAAAACRRGTETPLNNSLLLVPPLAMVIRLVFAFRAYSISPALSTYYMEMLALVLLTLAFYRLSSFGFRAGRSRIFCLYAALAVVFALGAAADAASLASLLLYPGCALTLAGFLLLRLRSHHSA